MTFDDAFPQRRKIRIALAVSLALHIALLTMLRNATTNKPSSESVETRITVQLIPLQALQKFMEKTIPAKEEPTKRQSRRESPAKRIPAPAAPPAPALPEQTPIDKKDAPTGDPPAVRIDIEELMSAVRRDIGKIDRQLRKEHPNLPGAKMGSSETKLARDIAAAGKFTGGWLTAPTIEPIADESGLGKRMYKVSYPGGHYCVTYESVARMDGYDLSKKFEKPKVTNCPRGH